MVPSIFGKNLDCSAEIVGASVASVSGARPTEAPTISAEQGRFQKRPAPNDLVGRPADTVTRPEGQLDSREMSKVWPSFLPASDCSSHQSVVFQGCGSGLRTPVLPGRRARTEPSPQQNCTIPVCRLLK
jgi:hypothetical protein